MSEEDVLGGGQLTGIKNVTNSCYVNAVSQLLIMIDDMSRLVSTNKKYKEYGNFLNDLLRRNNFIAINEHEYITQCIIPTGFDKSQNDPVQDLLIDLLNQVQNKNLFLKSPENRTGLYMLNFIDPKSSVQKNLNEYIFINGNFSRTSKFILINLVAQSQYNLPQNFELNENITIVEENQIKINKNYNLIAVVYHLGGVSAGHYIIAKKFNNDWYVINDDVVKKIRGLNDAELRNTRPYILLYENDNNSGKVQRPQEPKKNKITKNIIDKLLYSGAFHVYKSSMDAIIQEYITEVSNDKEIDNICEISKYIIESIKYELYSSADIDKKIKQLSLQPEIDANETQVRNSIIKFCESKNKIYKNKYNINKNVLEKMIVSGVFHVYKSSIDAIMQEYIDKISNDKEIDNICEISKYIIESIKYSLYSNTSIDPIVKKLALNPEIDANVGEIINKITKHNTNYIQQIYIKYGIKDVLMNYKNYMKPLIAPQNSIIETVSTFFSTSPQPMPQPSTLTQPKPINKPINKSIIQSIDNYELKNYISTNVQYDLPIGFGNNFHKIQRGHITVITMFFNTDEESKLNEIINGNYFSTYNENKKFNKSASASNKRVVALLNPFYGLEIDNWLFDKVYRYTKEITLTTPKYEKLGEKYAITYSDGKQNMGVLHKLIYDKLMEILQPGVSQQTITISGKQYYAIINNNTNNWIFATPKYADNIWHITVQSGVETDRDLIMRLPDLKNIKMSEKMMTSYLSFLKGDKLTVTGGSDSQNFDLRVDSEGRIFYNNVETPFSSLPQNIQNKLK